MNQRNLLVFVLAFISTQTLSQRALPGFTVKDLGKGKIGISWINPYPSCNQLAVQRSTDSINFRTIFSAQSPELPANGFIDQKLPISPRIYYRIFYVLKGGTYFFTEIKSPEQEPNEKHTNTPPDDIHARIDLPKTEIKKDSAANTVTEKYIRIYKRGEPAFQLSVTAYKGFRDSLIKLTQDSLSVIKPGEINWKPFIPKPKEYVSIFVKDTLLVQIELPFYKRFKDSVNNNTKDTIYQITTFRAELHRFIPKQVWKPSPYIYTNTAGYLNISVPEKDHQLYRIIFFDNEGKELFRVNKLKEHALILDKANFKKSGWYDFELYKNNELIEKNKFFLQKD
ncbi:MAG: hypothetical protein IBJ16_08690 [Chitinophagaceae bacterium]|nr:hypothetical protein [Chitinophagaceae bacterium]